MFQLKMTEIFQQKKQAPATQPEPASRLRSATRDVSFLRSDSRCRRYVNELSNVTPKYLGSEQKVRISFLWLTFNSRLASLLLRWTTRLHFITLTFSMQCSLVPFYHIQCRIKVARVLQHLIVWGPKCEKHLNK